MNAFTIKDLENLSGIKAHTIRIWEQRYSFLKPKRTETNIRYYSNEELKTLLNIALLNKYGYKISRIDKMGGEEIRRRLLLLSQQQAMQERIVNDLIQFMIEMDILLFEEELNLYIQARGIERAISQIIFPFLEKIGILWHTNQVNPAQEHLVSNIIRQKLIAGIESVVAHQTIEKTVVLFLPESHFHELGLLYVYYLLKQRGVKTIYLGASVPVSDLGYVVRLKSPDFVYSHITGAAPNFSLERFLQKLSQVMPESPVVVSGLVASQYRKQLPPEVSLRKTLQEVQEFVSSL